MDDISEKIGQILSDPNQMNEIMNIAKSLGLSPDEKEEEQKEEPQNNLSPDLLSMVTKLTPLLSQAKKEDDSTRLLRALKPLLSKNRQEKVDSAIKMIQLLRLLPVLKESGALSSVFGSVL